MQNEGGGEREEERERNGKDDMRMQLQLFFDVQDKTNIYEAAVVDPPTPHPSGLHHCCLSVWKNLSDIMQGSDRERERENKNGMERQSLPPAARSRWSPPWPPASCWTSTMQLRSVCEEQHNLSARCCSGEILLHFYYSFTLFFLAVHTHTHTHSVCY